ncbi:MAG: hypothetical protein JOY99_11555 [Sphingomonadaceae bacterium]|nr:hypothetical protein [Sphingomonadaceae bacterium]
MTTGSDQALALMESFEVAQGVTHFGIEMLAIATQGKAVLTERIDTMLGRMDGVETKLRLMGIFDVEDGRMTAWRDYFDTAALGTPG